MSMLSVSDCLSKRLFVLFSVIGLGASASLAKSLDIYGHAVDGVVYLVGGDKVLHSIVAVTLGFVASWATPKSYYQYSSIPFSPWVGLLLVAVSIDEFSQAYFPTRSFSWIELGINLTGVMMGSFIYLFYITCRYPSYLR